MKVEEIVKEWLKAQGYDGLFNEAGECACLLEDLAPCGELSGECQAGHKIQCSDVVDDFQIVPEREVSSCETCPRWDEESEGCLAFMLRSLAPADEEPISGCAWGV